MEHPEHTFSWQALARILFLGIAIILAWQARGAFVDILIALVIAVSLYPTVTWIKRTFRIPHAVSVFVVLFLLLIPVALFVFIAIPLVSQAPALVTSLLVALTSLGVVPHSVSSFNIAAYIQTHTDAVLASGTSILFIGLSVVTIIILAFYFIFDSYRLLELFFDFFPEAEQPKLRALLEEIGAVTGRYVRGNMLISLICVVVVAIGLLALQVPYAIPLALFAGVLDLLPLVGSTLGAVPAVLIALGISPLKGIFVIILYLAYQQIESAFISPMIYNKALNISSALSFLSVVIGAGIFGILGAFLALPIAASIPVLIRYQKAYGRRHRVHKNPQDK